MEDPAKEIADVVRGLVEKPTLKRQAAVLQKYFTSDVQFYHFYINTNGGLKDLTAIYQMAELIVNYQGVEFQKIIYDEKANSMALRMSVFTRPWGILPLTTLKFFTMLELQDCKTEVLASSIPPLHPFLFCFCCSSACYISVDGCHFDAC